MATFSSLDSSHHPHDWEHVKENAAPISRGRTIASSSSSSSCVDDAAVPTLLERKEQYERQIVALSSSSSSSSSPSNNDDDNNNNNDDHHHHHHDDPLQIWIDYLKFLQDEIYKGTKSVSTSAALFQLYEQCVHSVLSSSSSSQQQQHSYRADRRFIRICCLYADASYDPLATFYELHTIYGVGGTMTTTTSTTAGSVTTTVHVDPNAATALFFNAWAYTAESQHYFTLTQHIFQTGLRLLLRSSSDADAMRSLQLRHSRFQKRMHRYWRNYQQQLIQDSVVEEGEGTTGSTQLDTENPHYRQELLRYHQPHHPPATTTTNPHAPSSSRRGILHPLSSTVHRQFAPTDEESPLAWQLLLPPSARPQQQRSSSQQQQQLSTFTDRRRRRHHHPTDQVNVPSSQQPPLSFAVFSDTAPEPAFPRHHHHRDTHLPQSTRPMVTEAERYKENQTHIPVVEKWNESGPLRNTYSTETRSTTNHHHRPTPPLSLLLTNTAVGFAIHMDDDCRRQQQAEETARQEHEAQHRRGRDERQGHAASTTTTTTTTRPMWKHRLLTHSTTRTEQSFEEARYRQGYYQVAVVATNTNNNAADQSQSDMEEEEDSSVNHSQLLLPQNTSTNSCSTYDHRNEQHPPSEPTIHTQFAMRELSFLFASPVLAVPSHTAARVDSPHHTAVLPENDDPVPHHEISPTTARRVTDPTPPFTIYEEEGPNDNHVSSTGFAIFCDHHDSVVGVDDDAHFHFHDTNNTNDAMAVPSADQRIDDPLTERRGDDTTDCVPLPHVPTAPRLTTPNEGTKNRSSPEECHSHGDTATFPLLLWSDLDRNCHANIDHDETTLESPQLAFGNISVIVPSDDTTSMIPVTDSARSFRYTDVHTRNIHEGTTRLKGSTTTSGGSFPRRTTLARVLSNAGCVYDLPTCVLPRSFKQGMVQVGTEFVMDTCSAVVDQVIAQTSNETVVMLRENGIGPMMLKSQSPMVCLAWEYHILQIIGDRIPNEEHSTSKTTSITTSPFPRALSFVILADGAMLSTSTGSKTGWNLIHLKRAYDATGDEIPEVLILHYTARMLQHIELLHWHAKVLHCNVKPENWILTCNWSEKDQPIESDLMLVDFGHAVDLADIHRNNLESEKNWMDQVLIGSPTLETAKCVSMRLGLPWSFDIDTFGICACVHLLMHGTPFDIQPTKEPRGEKRWESIRKFPRHFQLDLWQEIFDTLLNLDEDFGRAIGSRPYNLKRLRRQIEEHLQTGHNVALLDAAFRNQSLIQPP